MDIYEIRRENSRQLAKEAGNMAEFAKRIERSDSYVNQRIGKTIVKNIGYGLARHIESCFEKPPLWLDQSQSNMEIREESSTYADSIQMTEILAIEVARALKGQFERDWRDASPEEAGKLIFLLAKVYREKIHGRDRTAPPGRDQSTKSAS